MTQRLNITNGDSAAATLSEAGVEGKIISWRDVLHEGPVDSSLSLEELSKERARFISEQGWDDFAHVSGDFTEREALAAIDAGHSKPVAAFLEVARLQESIFLGDIVFYSYLDRLSGKTDALVTWKDGTPVIAPTSERSRAFVEGELTLTPLGREVLAGNKDWHRIHKRTRWLGGVEINPGEAGWRWDPAERLVRRDAAAAKKTKIRVAKKRSSPPAKKANPRSPARRAARKQK